MKLKMAVATAVLLLSMAFVSPAFAQYVGGKTPAAGRSESPPAAKRLRAVTVRVAGQSTTRAGRLAFTGADIAQLVAIGGVFVVSGVALTRRARRQPEFTGA